MSSTLGDFLLLAGPVSLPPGIDRVSQPGVWPAMKGVDKSVRYFNAAPGIHVWSRGDLRLESGQRGGLGFALEPLQGRSLDASVDPRLGSFSQWQQSGRWTHERFNGRYAYVFWDTNEAIVRAYTDPFRTCPLYYAEVPCGFLIASDLRLLLRTGLFQPTVSLSALYQYLNFSYIPAPLTAIEQARKLPSGHCLEISSGRARVRSYWDAQYPADLDEPEAVRVERLRRNIVQTVSSYRCGDTNGWGTFLSGGTDSSSIAGILSGAQPTPLKSFSIGFEEPGYDELTYSRIASSHYKLVAHEHRMNEDDAVSSVERLAIAFDEPFGNSSAIPTLRCAELAAGHGVSLLMAGDGGDEIFGGNERYRKDKIFETFHRAPMPARHVAQAIARGLQSSDHRFANRIKNFVHRGSMPNPERFYSDDSFASDHFEELLSDDFRSVVRRDDALDVQRHMFKQAKADCDLHRLMYLDLKLTIADNDVVKVVRAAKLAGVQVAFPYLDRRLVEFAGRLPGTDKVRRLHKRHLFKLATQNILPEEIRKKKKQGFGLPVSVWLRRGGRYRDLANDIATSSRAAARGYFKPDFIRKLVDRHEKGAWDHSAEIHMLMMLELWHREFVDAHA